MQERSSDTAAGSVTPAPTVSEESAASRSNVHVVDVQASEPPSEARVAAPATRRSAASVIAPDASETDVTVPPRKDAGGESPRQKESPVPEESAEQAAPESATAGTPKEPEGDATAVAEAAQGGEARSDGD